MKLRLRQTIVRFALRFARPASGLHPVGDYEPGDVFIVGFPKSGHTWMQYLIAGLASRLDVAHCSDALVQETIPDVQRRLIYRRYTQPMFFKAHLLPQPEYKRVIYLLRDGRDAMVSYWHYYNAMHPAVDFASLVQGALGLDARWQEHVEAWLANPFSADMLVVRYEDLRKDPVRELGRIAQFVGIETDRELLAAVAAAADFDKQRKREAEKGWDNKSWPQEKRFVRRGAIGSFRDEMPEDALALFLDEAGPTLKRLGYFDRCE